MPRFFSESVNSSMTEGEELRLGLISIVGRRWVCQWPLMFSFKIELRTFFENSTYEKIMYRSNESIYCVSWYYFACCFWGVLEYIQPYQYQKLKALYCQDTLAKECNKLWYYLDSNNSATTQTTDPILFAECNVLYDISLIHT